MVSKWKNSEELGMKCSVALMKAFTAYPRPGWIRATEKLTTEMAGELSRLSKENSELRQQLKSSDAQTRQRVEDADQSTIKLLSDYKVHPSVMMKGETEWKSLKDVTLLTVFHSVAPVLFDEDTTRDLAGSVAIDGLGQDPSRIRHPWPIPSNVLNHWLADFAAIGLIVPSIRKRGTRDKDSYWTLTDVGRRVAASLRRTMIQGAVDSNRQGNVDNEKK